MSTPQTERNVRANRARRFLQHELGMHVVPAHRNTGLVHGPHKPSPWARQNYREAAAIRRAMEA
jgi:hypothetical protein